ncbi:hypothetical protein [Polaribacter sp.]|uniref:hypothetical protein n=1 Tax=Polaribacter sp. TaxID=1920175 RepID=UPI003EFB3724
MRKKIAFLPIVFLFFIATLQGQNFEQKWTAGIHAAMGIYSEADKDFVGGKYVFQTPRITLSRYMFSNITFNAGFATALGDSQKYTSIDGAIRYDFGMSMDNIVPYFMLGGSIINALRPTPTIDIGAGITLWFSEQYGLTVQSRYKISLNTYESQRSHAYFSGGLVYSFKARSMRPRLWNDKH